MHSIKRLFNPTSKRFYTLFRQVADNICEMEHVFIQFLYENESAAAASYLKEIEALEHRNDLTTHKLIIELGRNFITPFDREDIHALASTLDDIADFMYAIAKQRINYQIAGIPRASQIIADKQKTATKLLCEILSSLDDKNLIKYAVMSHEIKSILHECDSMIDAALSALLTEQKNAIEAIKLTDHYNYMQELIDKYEDATNVIESIIIKYS